MNPIDTIFVDNIRSSRAHQPGTPRNWGHWQPMYELKTDGCPSAGKGWRCRCFPEDLSAFTHRHDGTEICFDHYFETGRIHSTGACAKYTERYGERWWDASDFLWSSLSEDLPVC